MRPAGEERRGSPVLRSGTDELLLSGNGQVLGS